MKFNKTLTALGCALAASSMSGVAVAEVSANVGVTSNYIWRGVTQTDDKAAISGGIDYSHESGFYLGTWASNIDWPTAGGTGAEVDFYGGYGSKAGPLDYDVGLIYYYYPQHNNSDFSELYASANWQWLTLGFAYTLDGDATAPAPFTDGDLYYYAGLSFDLPEDWSIGFTVGQYDFDDDGAAGDINYTHYQLDVGKNAGDFGDFTFSVSDADKESGDPDTKVFVSWNKSF